MNDYINYLQKELGEEYIVSKELNMNIVDLNKTYVVVSQVAGTITGEQASIPYQISIYTQNPSKQMDFFTKFAREHDNTTIKAIVENEDKTTTMYVVKQVYPTPMVMQTDFELGNEIYSRLVMLPTLNVTMNLNDISKIQVDGENLAYMNGSLSYVAEIYSNPISGQEINVNNKRRANVTIDLSGLNKTTIFGRKLALIRQGKLSGNTVFDIDLTMTDGSIEHYPMMVSQISVAFDIRLMPSIHVIMLLASPKEN